MEDRLYTIWISEPKAITLNKNFFFFLLKEIIFILLQIFL